MKIVKVRFGMGHSMDEYGSPNEPWASDRFVSESEAAGILETYKSAKVIGEREVDIVLADKFDPTAPLFYWDAFERAAIFRVARPKEPACGYPKTLVTVMVDGIPHNVSFKIVPTLDPYDWPAWGVDSSQQFRVVKAAVAMFDGSGGGIGDLKRAVRGECRCGKIAAKDSGTWSDEPLCDEHLTEWRKQISKDIYLRGERSSYAYLGDWRAVAP